MLAAPWRGAGYDGRCVARSRIPLPRPREPLVLDPNDLHAETRTNTWSLNAHPGERATLTAGQVVAAFLDDPQPGFIPWNQLTTAEPDAAEPTVPALSVWVQPIGGDTPDRSHS
jgi:hypothetical protein